MSHEACAAKHTDKKLKEQVCPNEPNSYTCLTVYINALHTKRNINMKYPKSSMLSSFAHQSSRKAFNKPFFKTPNTISSMNSYPYK